MSTDQSPPGDGADGASQPVPAADPVTSATGKPGNGTESGTTDTNTNHPTESGESSILAELGITDDPEEATDPPPAEDDHKTEPEADQAKDPQAETKPDETELKPEDEAKPGFARKRIKNLNEERKKLQAELEALKPAAQALSAMQELVTKAGFTEGPEALEAMALIGRALKGKDPEAQAEIIRRLQASGATLPEPPKAPELDAEEQAIVADVESLHGVEASKKLAARLLAAKKPETAAPKAQEPPKPTPTTPEAAPAPSPEVRAAQAEIVVLSNAIRAEHGKAADEILREVTERVRKADRARFIDQGAGLPPNEWAKVFVTEREAVMAARRKATRPHAPTQIRSTPPPSNHDGPKSLTQEILDG